MALIPWRSKRPEDAGAALPSPRGFRSELDRLFDTYFREAFEGTGLISAGPLVDVEETDQEVCLRAEIPGVSAEDLDLSIVGNSLIISGEKKESQERREGGFVYQERRFGSFRREVPLPAAVEADNVQAEYKDGVLSVTMKKSQEALPKRIEVKAT